MPIKIKIQCLHEVEIKLAWNVNELEIANEN